jgi:hypothetical protein
VDKKNQSDDPAQPEVVISGVDLACQPSSHSVSASSSSSSSSSVPAAQQAHKFPNTSADPALRQDALYDLIMRSMGAPTPSRMLINVWKASQRVQEWAIRSKSQHPGSTFESLADELGVRAAFLLSVRPSPPPVLDFEVDTSVELPLGLMSPRNRYHAVALERSASAIHTSSFVESLGASVDGDGGGYDDNMRKCGVKGLSGNASLSFGPGATSSSSSLLLSASQTREDGSSSPSKSRQFAEAFSLSADVPPPCAPRVSGTGSASVSASIAKKLELYKRVSRQMTSASIGGGVGVGPGMSTSVSGGASPVSNLGAGCPPNARSHSDAVDAVLSFLQSGVQVDQLKDLMLSGSWRAMLRVVGLRLFRALLAGSHVALPQYPSTLSSTSSPPSRTRQPDGCRFAFVFQSSKIALLEWLPEAIRGKSGVAGTAKGTSLTAPPARSLPKAPYGNCNTSSTGSNAGVTDDFGDAVYGSSNVGNAASFGAFVDDHEGLGCGANSNRQHARGVGAFFPAGSSTRPSHVESSPVHKDRDAVLTVFDLPSFGLIDVDAFGGAPLLPSDGTGDDDEGEQAPKDRFARLARSGGHYLVGLGGCGRTLTRKVCTDYVFLYGMLCSGCWVMGVIDRFN